MERLVASSYFKVIFCLMSGMALIIWMGASVIGIDAALRGVRLPASYAYFIAFPFLYFPYCLLSCTKLLRGRTLVISGVIMHLALIAWVIVGKSSLNVTVGVVFTILWILLCIARIKSESEVT